MKEFDKPFIIKDESDLVKVLIQHKVSCVGSLLTKAFYEMSSHDWIWFCDNNAEIFAKHLKIIRDRFESFEVSQSYSNKSVLCIGNDYSSIPIKTHLLWKALKRYG